MPVTLAKNFPQRSGQGRFRGLNIRGLLGIGTEASGTYVKIAISISMRSPLSEPYSQTLFPNIIMPPPPMAMLSLPKRMNTRAGNKDKHPGIVESCQINHVAHKRRLRKLVKKPQKPRSKRQSTFQRQSGQLQVLKIT